MAKMSQLNPPVAIDIAEGWSLLAVTAGYYSKGLQADLHLYDSGELRESEITFLSQPGERKTFARVVAKQCEADADDVHGKLLGLKEQIEARLREMAEAEARPSAETQDGNRLSLEDPEPCDDPVDGESLITDVQAVIERFLALTKGASYTIALWILHTYLMIAIHTTPILLISSPQPRCGKSTLMAVLLALCYRALPTSNISPSAIFRSIEKWGPTLLIDEADSFMRHNDELRGIINSGHTRATAHVIRCDGDDHEPKLFSTWAPKAIAGIGRQAQTIEDRSIEIAMRRRLPTETVERFRMDRIGEFSDLNRRCVRWAIDHEDAIRESDPDVPDFLDDRAADNWRPLLQIADIAGGDCPTNARKALKLLCGEKPEEEESAAILLLRDLKAAFTSSRHDRVTSEDFATRLGDMEDRPWPEWGRQQKPITKREIAKLLKPFGIRPKPFKTESGSSLRGYLLEECQDAFDRYLPSDQPPTDESDENLKHSELSPSRPVTPKQPSNGAGMSNSQSVTPRPHVTDEKTRKPSTGADCYAVTDHNEGLAEKKNSESPTAWVEVF